MWKRDDAPRTATPGTPQPPTSPQAPALSPSPRPSSGLDRDVVNIGKSVVIKGELNGSEDLTIEGTVEGKIELREHVLTIGPNGRIKAHLLAKAVVVLGEVIGDVTATEKIDIRDNGSVEGDLISPRVAIAEGAHFRGSIDMQRTQHATRSEPKPEPRVEPKVELRVEPKLDPRPAVPPVAAAAKP